MQIIVYRMPNRWMRRNMSVRKAKQRFVKWERYRMRTEALAGDRATITKGYSRAYANYLLACNRNSVTS